MVRGAGGGAQSDRLLSEDRVRCQGCRAQEDPGHS